MTDVGQSEQESPADLEVLREASPAPFLRRRRRWLVSGILALCLLAGLLVFVEWRWSPYGLFDGNTPDIGSSRLPALDPASQALREEAFDAAERLVEKYPRDPDAWYSNCTLGELRPSSVRLVSA